ncbi:hypothetical protein Tco_0022865, partial [Tanacetum coccineum]
ERLKKTKRSKISQKPTRNGKDKTKSEDGKLNQSKAGSARYSKKRKQMKAQGPMMTSLQSLKVLLDILEVKGLKLQKD